MVQWLIIILAYNLAMVKLSFSEVTLSVRLLHYKNRNGLTYENRPCDSRLDHDINRDGRCDTAFLFCLVRLPFQNPHNCTLGDHFTGFVGADDIHFVNINQPQERSAFEANITKARPMSSPLISLWFQPLIQFRFKYPKTGVGLIVEVFDVDDVNNHTIHDSIDFYGRTLLDLKIYRSAETAQPQRIYLRSLFGMYTNLTADFSLYCSPNFFGNECEIFCLPNERRYECDSTTGQKICKPGHFGTDCLSDARACEDRPCLNNGTCLVYLHSYVCQCQKGFSGRSCEIAPNTRSVTRICNQSTCLHGDCSKTGSCICHDNWTSSSCNESSIIRETGCASRPCLHNSTCETLTGVTPSSAYRCHCRLGYTGRNCEVELVTSCERTPCVHGQCFKVDLFTEICVCEKHWNGVDCSQSLIPLPLFSETTHSNSLTAFTYRRILSTMATPIKTIKNLANTSSLKTDLRDYLNWLNANYGISRTTSVIPTMSKPPIADPFKYTPCLSAPCLHNSTCVVKSEHSFQCVCSPMFIGIYCEIEILRNPPFRQNPCESSPCHHQSVCIAASKEHIQCICRPHYTGKFCEYPIPFQPVAFNETCARACQNGGICLIVEPNGEQCICKSSYTGVYCELSKNNCSNHNDPSCNTDPCLSNPCLFNGTCHSKSPRHNFTCSCDEEYTGLRCELEIDFDSFIANAQDMYSNLHENKSANNTDLWPLAIVFGYIFSLMLVFIIIWFLWYGLTIRPQSYIHSDIPYEERVSSRYQPYRLGVSNPLFFTNQEYSTPMSKTFLTPPTTISNLDQWTRTITR